MERISSSGFTIFRKFVYPIIILGVFAYFEYDYFVGRATGGNFLIPLGLGLVFLLFWWREDWPLVDIVDDAGEKLIVKRAGRMQQLFLSDVAEVVSHSGVFTQGPYTVTLYLHQSGLLGGTITFIPKTGCEEIVVLLNARITRMHNRERSAR